MVTLSCSVTLTCVTVTRAWVASVFSVRPPMLTSDRKLDSHSASSPGAKGGISGGGLAGSKVRSAKATGCFLDDGSRRLPG